MKMQKKSDRSDRNRKMIAGVQKHLGTSSIVVQGSAMAPADVVKGLQGSIDAADATTAATAAFHQAVAAEKSASTQGDALYAGLRGYLVNLYRSQPDVLADFGLTLGTRQVPDASTVAAAVEKRAATRAARHTMGKRQKEAITGTVAPAAPATPPAAAPHATAS